MIKNVAVLPNESQESATKYFDYDEVFTMGKEKGEELACFLATNSMVYGIEG